MENTNDTLSGAAAGAQNVGAATTPVQETQAVSAPSGNAETTPAETNQPEKLYAGKYKSAEELEKGYIESQKLIGDRKQLEEQANLLKEVAKASGLSVDQIKEQIAEKAKEAEMQSLGTNDPVVYEMKKRLDALEAEKMQSAFDSQFAEAAKAYPFIDGVKDTIKDMYGKAGNMSVQSLVEQLYAPVISKVQNTAAQQLGEKAGATVMSSQGSGAAPIDEASKAISKAVETGNTGDIESALSQMFRKK